MCYFLFSWILEVSIHMMFVIFSDNDVSNKIIVGKSGICMITSRMHLDIDNMNYKVPLSLSIMCNNSTSGECKTANCLSPCVI
jgi:hypothetical protein